MEHLRVLAATVSSLLERAEHFSSIGRRAEAERTFERAIEIDPGFRARFEFAAYLAEAEQELNAIDQFQMLAESARRATNWEMYSIAMENLAAIHRNLGTCNGGQLSATSDRRTNAGHGG